MELVIVIGVLIWCGIKMLIEKCETDYNNRIYRESKEEFRRTFGFEPKTDSAKESKIKIAVNKQAIHEGWGHDWARIQREVSERCFQEKFLSYDDFHSFGKFLYDTKMKH